MRTQVGLAGIVALFPAFASAQQSAAPLDAPLVTLGIYDRYGIVTDLDNDGFMDAVSWWWTDGYTRTARLRAWHNDGHGKLVEAWTAYAILAGSGTGGVRLFRCNLDSDGLEDFYMIATRSDSGRVQAWRSSGLSAPVYAPEYQHEAKAAEFHALVADFSGDGRADLAYSADGVLRFLEYTDGVLELRAEVTPFGSTTAVSGLLLIDANGDATPDVLAWNGATLKLIEVADCMPSATQTYTQGIVNNHMPAAGDVDGDGDQDLVIWDMSHYVVARRNGAAAWSIEPRVAGGPAEFLVDVDQDGDLDGACCGSGDPDAPPNTSPSTLRIAVNDGTGSFAPALETNWLGSDHLAGIVDLDHDGDMDVVSGRCVLYARRPLTEVLHPRLGSAQSNRSIADVDGDSDPDFRVGLRTMERNLGQGLASSYVASFPAPPPGTTFVGPGWPGDFDGDGDLDFVVKHYSGPTLLGQRLLSNLGGGAFTDAGPAGPSGVAFNEGVVGGDGPEASLAADVDGDGDVDLITLPTNPATSTPSRIWLNDGVGQFAAGIAGSNVRVHDVADINGDGLTDLVSVGSDFFADLLYWHEGLGGGAFGPRQGIGSEFISWDANRCTVADLDADGDPDVASTGNGDPHTLRIRWNNGAGSFSVEYVSSVSWSTSAPMHRVWNADLDGDGLLDLVVSPASDAKNGVRILMRESDNSGWRPAFSQVVFASSGTNPILLDAALRDVDGDMDPDFVTDRLVRNGDHEPPRGGLRWQSEGGVAGMEGLVPTLGARGPFRFGAPAELRLTGGVGGASGLLTIYWVGETAHARGALGSGTDLPERIFARIPFTLSGASGTAGTGTWTLPFTVQANAIGRTRHYVVEIPDPLAPGGMSRSNGLWITYGY